MSQVTRVEKQQNQRERSKFERALEIQDGARNSNEGGKMESGPLSLRLG